MRPLRDWIAGYALDAVRAQTIWNLAQEQDRALPPELRPAPQLLRSYDVGLHMLMAGARAAGFEVAAAPLNLGYSIQFRTRSETAAVIRFTVEQCPLDPGP